MSGLEISLGGVEKLLSSLDALSDEVREKTWAHIQQSAVNVRDRARSNAPKRTGKFRKGFKIKYDEDALEAVVYNNVFYSPFVELGTKREPAHPTLSPAVDEEKDAFLSGLADVLK